MWNSKREKMKALRALVRFAVRQNLRTVLSMSDGPTAWRPNSFLIIVDTLSLHRTTVPDVEGWIVRRELSPWWSPRLFSFLERFHWIPFIDCLLVSFLASKGFTEFHSLKQHACLWNSMGTLLVLNRNSKSTCWSLHSILVHSSCWDEMRSVYGRMMGNNVDFGTIVCCLLSFCLYFLYYFAVVGMKSTVRRKQSSSTVWMCVLPWARPLGKIHYCSRLTGWTGTWFPSILRRREGLYGALPRLVGHHHLSWCASFLYFFSLLIFRKRQKPTRTLASSCGWKKTRCGKLTPVEKMVAKISSSVGGLKIPHQEFGKSIHR